MEPKNGLKERNHFLNVEAETHIYLVYIAFSLKVVTSAHIAMGSVIVAWHYRCNKNVCNIGAGHRFQLRQGK